MTTENRLSACDVTSLSDVLQIVSTVSASKATSIHCEGPLVLPAAKQTDLYVRCALDAAYASSTALTFMHVHAVHWDLPDLAVLER